MNSEHMTGYQFCRDMYQDLRKRGLSPKFIAEFVGRSNAALRRYMSEPGTVSAQKPPVEVTDRLVALVDLSTSERRVSTEAEIRHQRAWIDVVNSDIVPHTFLADIAGVSTHHLAWVGRSHPEYGIQPTEDQVLRAMATEALMQGAAA
ncbi:hypothetical protein GHL01_00300 [Sinorhizobium meliloti]|uniref:hypothetical protein n=1 Tax=Rhizobium meliloti TaxID=382 RepID=UPI0012969F28|nr:hypothetical protein [Sinorhizobium meliloti]MQV12185.1 hypothetical protein [Sinorhizobium meliloti]